MNTLQGAPNFRLQTWQAAETNLLPSSIWIVHAMAAKVLVLNAVLVRLSNIIGEVTTVTIQRASGCASKTLVETVGNEIQKNGRVGAM